ncbi:hypothetical protein [Kineococcus rubinsiae]|uniref:hypothetical protein n=1 Tax=Kineococcus rubinsiae TaxID=2609562 RepID=UPI001431BCED|nr:hypothetical protein [Kineococcus rubinsiae]NIZ92133.1 hypothetical protein [Kineococcus rubinsiae]
MKTLRCRLGRHRWTTEFTEDRKPYRVCARCRNEDWLEPSRPNITDMTRTEKFINLGARLGPPG